MLYIVSRNCGHHKDYLSGWCAEYGTESRMSRESALTFATREEAESACEKARQIVPEWHGLSGERIEYRVEQKTNCTKTIPSPADIRSARETAGLTQRQAAGILSAGLRTWEAWESPVDSTSRRVMPHAKWKLFNILLGNNNS